MNKKIYIIIGAVLAIIVVAVILLVSGGKDEIPQEQGTESIPQDIDIENIAIED